MATMIEHAGGGWHPGEQAVHVLLKSPNRQNPTSAGLPPSLGHRVAASPLLAIATMDDQGRPWTSIWGGERGFARPVAPNILGIQSLVNKAHDPVVQAFLTGAAEEGTFAQPEGGKPMSALSIDLDTRDRVKLGGKILVTSLAPRGDTVSDAQIAMRVDESLGNCPKYLNKKTIRAHVPSPELVSSTLPLPPSALSLISKADLFFLSSTHGTNMDTNHRGGPPGFIRVVSNSPDGVVLAYPEYSGNQLYQTLGNLHTNPLAGLAIPDLSTSSILHLTGSATLLTGTEAAAFMPRAPVAVVKITVTSAILVHNALPFLALPGGEPSPYNPPVRRLAAEAPDTTTLAPPTTPLATATLLKREVLTPTIARFTFRLAAGPSKEGVKWRAGQHLTLSFASELDVGYSHMRPDNPGSLNDDFVRTFTISSPPPPPSPPSGGVEGQPKGDVGGQTKREVEIQLTLRKHAAVTGLLFNWRLGQGAGELVVPVLGVGGEERFGLASRGARKGVFVAGGIGITPFLAQAEGLGAGIAGVEVLWSVRGEDLGAVVDALGTMGEVGRMVKVFITGEAGEEVEGLVERVRGLGAQVEVRRMGREDVLGARDAVRGTKYFACASPGMMRAVLGWIGEEEVATESFEY
ncbi:hypothetical protein C8A05DRAFT_45458 [Staphylotrichum tortipilum]|uniref:FAD-binding FR-type domain-containing protein n=1 Tax=Staphylotrichum tortipilum TaxID=2831512 RepID=A0AAN6MHN4_9PEZI|nr:hypothetical protein C8A05DRAFT_45458 [Staphylotrichum longicolle]